MKLFQLILLSFILIVSGCASNNRSAWTVMDSWYNAPKEAGLTPWDWSEVKFSEVNKLSQKQAETLLESSPISEISKEQMVKFALSPLQIPKNLNFYLVRGVYLNEGTGSFSVYYRGTQLWVYHGSLGRNPVTIKRKTLIIALDKQPTDIYATCMMDE